MKFTLRSILVVFAVCVGAGQVGSAQTNNDVAQWLERDTTALLNISNVPTTIDRVSELDVFANPRFLKAIEMLSDQRFPILESKDAPLVWERLEELKNLAKQISQVSFAIHKYDENEFSWTLFLRAENEALTAAEQEIAGVDELLKSSLRIDDGKKENSSGEDSSDATDSIDSDEDKSQKENSEDEGVESGATESGHSSIDASETINLGWCKLRRVDKWLVLSNHRTFIEGLPKRIEDTTFRSLGKSRKYRAVALRKSPLNKGDGRISIYAMPVNLKNFFPIHNEDSWDLLKAKEMPACGINIVITEPDDDPAKSIQPTILADAVVKHTEPAAGYAKQFKNYHSFEIPPLAIEPIELLAVAKDERLCAEIAVQTYDEKNGVGAAEQFWKMHFEGTGIDAMEDAVPRRKALFQMRFVDDEHSIDEPGSLSLESVKDYGAAQRFAKGIAKYARDQEGRPLVRSELNGKIWWKQKGNRFKENSGIFRMDRYTESRFYFFNISNDAYVLSDDWFVQGDMPAVEQQVELLDGGGGKDHGIRIREMMSDLTNRLKPNGPVVLAQYFTRNAWQENINKVENDFSMENVSPLRYHISLDQLASTGGVIDFGVLKSTEGGGRSYELQLKPNPNMAKNDDDNESSERKPITLKPLEDLELGKNEADNDEFEFQFQTLAVHMPMPLIARNEDGYRFELKNRRCLKKAVEVMLLTSLAETFPRQMFLYTKEEGNIRVVAGAYRNAPNKVDDPN